MFKIFIIFFCICFPLKADQYDLRLKNLFNQLQETEIETEIETVHNVADYISTDKHHLKSINQEPIEKKQIKNTVSSVDEDKYGHENSNYLNGVRRYYSNVNFIIFSGIDPIIIVTTFCGFKPNKIM